MVLCVQMRCSIRVVHPQSPQYMPMLRYMVANVRGMEMRLVSQLNVAMLPKYQSVSGVVHSWAANDTDSEPMMFLGSL